MQGEKSTCLLKHKATLMLFCSCSLETSGLPINSLIFYSKQTSGTNMQSRQTRTTKNNTPIKKGLKKRTRFGSKIANARNTKSGTTERFGLSQTRASHVLGIF
jgi:hypothetical protein